MMKKSSNNWKAERQKGKTHFVIKNGVLLWGIPVAVFWSIFNVLLDRSNNLFLHLAVGIPVFAIAGTLWALWMWQNKEKKFLKEESNPS